VVLLTVPPPAGARTFQFLLLTIAATVAAFGRFTVSPLQEPMRIALGLSDIQIALLQGPALALPTILAAIPLGLLVDRCSRVRLLFGMAVLDLLGGVLTATATQFPVLMLSRGIVGLSTGAVSTIAFSLLADLYGPAQRGRASMIVVVGQYGGMSAAFALGGALAAATAGESDGWRLAMLGLSGPLALAMVSTLVMREPARIGAVREGPPTLQAFAGVWQHRAVVAPLLLGSVAAEMAVLAVMTWSAPTLSRSFSLSADRIGGIMAMAVLVSGVVGPIAGGLLADLCQRTGGPRLTLITLCGLALLAAPASSFAIAHDVSLAAILLVLFMTLVGAIMVMAITLFTVVVPNELRGLCLAILAGANTFFGVAVAPVVVSLLSGAIGGPARIGKALILVCMVASLFGAVTFALGARAFRQVESVDA
jgi:predicted MFS family arabinose efflux permease